MPNRRLKPEGESTEEESLLLQMRCDPQTGTAFLSRETMLLAGAADGTSSDVPAQIFWRYCFCIWF